MKYVIALEMSNIATCNDLRETLILINQRKFGEAIDKLEKINEQIKSSGVVIDEKTSPIRWAIQILNTRDEKVIPVATHIMQAVVNYTKCLELNVFEIIKLTD